MEHKKGDKLLAVLSGDVLVVLKWPTGKSFEFKHGPYTGEMPKADTEKRWFRWVEDRQP